MQCAIDCMHPAVLFPNFDLIVRFFAYMTSQ